MFFVVCAVLFCLLIPSHCASSDDKNVSTSTKVRLESVVKTGMAKSELDKCHKIILSVGS